MAWRVVLQAPKTAAQSGVSAYTASFFSRVYTANEHGARD